MASVNKNHSKDLVVQEADVKPDDELNDLPMTMDWADEAHRQVQRQKQVDFGKNTLGYQKYLKAIPKEKRRRGDPMTPDPTENMSKKKFDGQIRVWRRMLHEYDEKDVTELETLQNQGRSSSSSLDWRKHLKTVSQDMSSHLTPPVQKSSQVSPSKKRDHKEAFKQAPRVHLEEAKWRPEEKEEMKEAAKQKQIDTEGARATQVLKAFAANAMLPAGSGKETNPKENEVTARLPLGSDINVFDMIMNDGSRSWMDCAEEEDIKL